VNLDPDHFVSQNSVCCGYGDTGKNTKGYDCLVIPGASKFTGKTILAANHFCGNALVTANNVASTSKTICSESYLKLDH
jgi:hypothetical protein